jgi:hypothetical protein
MLATTTWVCSCGSPAREMRCRYDAARNPSPPRRSTPSRPRRVQHASRSRYARATPTARSCDADNADATVSSSIANSTLTLFGAENVRSNPATVDRSPIPRSNAPSEGPGRASTPRTPSDSRRLPDSIRARERLRPATAPETHPHPRNVLDARGDLGVVVLQSPPADAKLSRPAATEHSAWPDARGFQSIGHAPSGASVRSTRRCRAPGRDATCAASLRRRQDRGERCGAGDCVRGQALASRRHPLSSPPRERTRDGASSVPGLACVLDRRPRRSRR